jgi:thiol:disulfide interchange protein DsbD
VHWRHDGERLVLRIDEPSRLPSHATAVFFPATSGVIEHAATQTLVRQPDAWTLRLKPGEQPPRVQDHLAGVLVLSSPGQPDRALAIGQDLGVSGGPATVGLLVDRSAAEASSPSRDADPASMGLVGALGLAVLGGLVLNLMPCVFPVLSIKALSVLQSVGQTREQARWHGLTYAAGVLASFALLAILLVVLRAGGTLAGWGFQFQSPAFVLIVILLLFGVGLNLSGVMTLGVSMTGVGSSWAGRDGPAGSFFTGVLATVVATPCTAPFMGAALGYAVAQPAAVALLVFEALGLGLALPYVLLCWWPGLQRRLPWPGVWMEHLKQALAFPMYASAAWLLWVLAQQAGTPALAVALTAVVILALAAWLHGRTQMAVSARTAKVGGIVALLLTMLAVGGGARAVAEADATMRPPGAAAGDPVSSWETYTPQRLQALRIEGRPVFVNLTADWCITCLVNEKVALSRPEVEAAFAARGVTRLKGDWTRRDETITRLLAEHGRSGVPLYLYYPTGRADKPVVLPQVLTPERVLSEISSAASVHP